MKKIYKKSVWKNSKLNIIVVLTEYMDNTAKYEEWSDHAGYKITKEADFDTEVLSGNGFKMIMEKKRS